MAGLNRAHGLDELINILENKAIIINDLVASIEKHVKLADNVKIQKNINNSTVRSSPRLTAKKNSKELKRLRNLYDNTNDMGKYINYLKSQLTHLRRELAGIIVDNPHILSTIRKGKRYVEIRKAINNAEIRRIIGNIAKNTMNENHSTGAGGGAGGAGGGGGEAVKLDDLLNALGNIGDNMDGTDAHPNSAASHGDNGAGGAWGGADSNAGSNSNSRKSRRRKSRKNKSRKSRRN